MQTFVAGNKISQGLDIKDDILAFAANELVALARQNTDSMIALQDVYTLKGHSAKITAILFTFDGILVTGSSDRTIILWKLEGGKYCLWQVLKGHDSGIVSVAGLEKEFLVASSDSNGNIKIWSLLDNNRADCTQTLEVKPHLSMSLAMARLSGGEIALFSGGTDLKLTLFLKSTDNIFKRILALDGHSDWIRSIKICRYTGDAVTSGMHPGDLMIATASQDKYIRIWRLGGNDKTIISAGNIDILESALSGTQISTKAHVFGNYSVMLNAILLGHDDWVFSVNWHPVVVVNGVVEQPMTLISSSADKSILVWNPDRHSESWIPNYRMGEIGGSTLGFYCAIFSSDGKTIFSNGYNGAIHAWGFSEVENNWAPLIGLSGHSMSVEDCRWDPSGEFLLSTSLDQTTRIFTCWGKTNTWHEISRAQIHGYNIECIAFTNKYEFVSGADEKVIRIFEAPRNFAETLGLITGHKESEETLQRRPIGANLPALGLSNKPVFVGEGPQANTDLRLNAYTAGSLVSALTSALDHPPFEEHLMQNTLWPEKEKLYGHGYDVISVCATHNGQIVATTSKASKTEDAVIRLWSVFNWKPLCEPLSFHTLSVPCMAFSKSDKYLLSASRDRSWALFLVEHNGDEVKYILYQSLLKAHARIIWDCCFCHDDFMFATASRDKTVKIY